MCKRIALTVIVVLALALSPVFAGPKDEVKSTPNAVETKAVDAKAGGMAMGHRFANAAAVCGCGRVFVPAANTKTFEFEGKEYACCTDECHKKLTSITPAEAAKACETQMAKLATPTPMAAPTTPASPK